MRRISKKQQEYRKWIDQIARPHVLDRDGPMCRCPGGCNAFWTDLDHIKGVGSHPESKMDLDNLQGLCRFPCHRNKTDHNPCLHNMIN